MSQAEGKSVATWRKVLAAILDFLTIFILGGYVVGYLTGSLTPGGFQLRGGSAFALVAVIIAYFVVFPKYLAARYGNDC
jgi:DMSO reductase anchor subunit